MPIEAPFAFYRGIIAYFCFFAFFHVLLNAAIPVHYRRNITRVQRRQRQRQQRKRVDQENENQ